jgi:medium-chain acyl-[acyl-carrier-protein] hydrolase
MSWIQRRHVRPDAALRLFCFPYAGGSAGAFRGWEAELPRDIELCPVQLPGRENRLSTAPLTDMVELVRQLGQVLPSFLDRPCAFFGHSLGARIAFELARHLRSLGLPQPVHLFASGSRAPHLPDSSSPDHDTPDNQLTQKLRELGGTPGEILLCPELMRLLLPTIRADFKMIETCTFTPGRPLSCDLSAFGGLDDEFAAPTSVEAWSQHTSGMFMLRMFEGGHFFIQSSRQEVLADLRVTLRRILAVLR